MTSIQKAIVSHITANGSMEAHDYITVGNTRKQITPQSLIKLVDKGILVKKYDKSTGFRKFFLA